MSFSGFGMSRDRGRDRAGGRRGSVLGGHRLAMWSRAGSRESRARRCRVRGVPSGRAVGFAPSHHSNGSIARLDIPKEHVK